MRDNILAIYNHGGEFAFSSLSDFLGNRPFSLSVAIPTAISERGFRQTIVGAHLQDDWRWRPNVTVNLGVRYEMATILTEVQGKLTVLRHLTDAQPHTPPPTSSCLTKASKTSRGQRIVITAAGPVIVLKFLAARVTIGSRSFLLFGEGIHFRGGH
jgi:outer membrane receptor protein involved in Fe transport